MTRRCTDGCRGHSTSFAAPSTGVLLTGGSPEAGRSSTSSARPCALTADLDISVLRENLNALLETLKPAHAWAAINGHLKPLAAHLEDPRLHNIWLTETDGHAFVLQINIETGSSEGWTYRRCPSISLPWDRGIRRVHGLPTGTPATQLLWKAKDPRPRDTIDFAASLCLLNGEDRRWLARSVTTAHRESPWIRALTG